MIESVVVGEWPLLMHLLSLVLLLSVMLSLIFSFMGVGFALRCLFLGHRWGEWKLNIEQHEGCLECGSAIAEEEMWRITSKVRRCERCRGSEARNEHMWKRVKGSWVPEEFTWIATEKEKRELGVEG